MYIRDIDTVHHAYFFSVSNRVVGVEQCTADMERVLGMSLHGNPDFVYRSYDRMALEHAYELRELVSMRPLAKRVCILSIGVMLLEAQQALLKLFEDPPADTHFCIISESSSYLLPTLRSRFMVRDIVGAKEGGANIKEFMALSLTDKMTHVLTIAEEGTEATRRFLDDMERYLHADSKTHATVLARILEGKTFLLLPSASRKGILESIVLSL